MGRALVAVSFVRYHRHDDFVGDHGPRGSETPQGWGQGARVFLLISVEDFKREKRESEWCTTAA